jgi:hypothetical protein
VTLLSHLPCHFVTVAAAAAIVLLGVLARHPGSPTLHKRSSPWFLCSVDCRWLTAPTLEGSVDRRELLLDPARGGGDVVRPPGEEEAVRLVLDRLSRFCALLGRSRRVVGRDEAVAPEPRELSRDV